MALIEISNGELLDRLSILIIKANVLTDQKPQIQADFAEIEVYASNLLAVPDIQELFDKLMAVNRTIWTAMQGVYDWHGPRDASFVDHVVTIIDENQTRARLKRDIDIATASRFREAKSFFSGLDT
jgi:hypothetical protein